MLEMIAISLNICDLYSGNRLVYGPCHDVFKVFSCVVVIMGPRLCSGSVFFDACSVRLVMRVGRIATFGAVSICVLCCHVRGAHTTIKAIGDVKMGGVKPWS